MEKAAPVVRINCLIKPTPVRRPSLGGALQWRLISHFSLNYLSIVEGGEAALKEILNLYDFDNSAATRQQINGIVSLQSRHVTKRIKRSFCRGTQVTITFDEDKMVGAGLYLFACVLERFLGQYVSVNSFSQLVLKTIQKKEAIKTMASPKRQSGPSIEDSLFEEFYGFSFYKAVNLLETLYPDRKPLGQTLEPNSEVVRFSVKPGFIFPASDISNLAHGGDDRPANMEVTFMGLIGPSGVLPHWYNELALERIRKKDFSLTAFFDIFHHRLISLFYLAWKKYRFPENYVSGAEDRRSHYALSLLGLGTPGLAGRIGLPKESMIFYSGLLSRTVPSALAIESAVEYFCRYEGQGSSIHRKSASIEPGGPNATRRRQFTPGRRRGLWQLDLGKSDEIPYRSGAHGL